MSYSEKYAKYKNKYTLAAQSGGMSLPEVNIVLYSADWCGYCTEFKPIWENLQKKFKAFQNIKFIKKKYTRGDVDENIGPITSVPTIYIINNINNDANDAIEFSGNRSVDTLTSFIKNYAKQNV